ncbi:hypothetical protein I315_04488 [Cryptococcus gattii Ru294]|nr:hypothetical protein I315_04488 [Cryptococcus gattii Ru294]KJE00527.1 hypothetical protein I311_05866 [Cryptococcus gattii NT-10]
MTSKGESAWVEPTEADVPPETADLDTQWAFIRAGIERIMPGPGKSSEAIPYHYYGLLYSSIYRYCTTPQKVSPEQGSQLSNENLYKHLTQWLRLTAEYCGHQQIDNLEDDQLLDFYGSEWGLFSSNVTRLNRLFSYLNRCWIKRSGAYPVDKLSNLSWKEHVFQHLVDKGKSSSLIDRVKERLKTYRNGQDVDVPLLENIVDNLMSLRLVKRRDLGVNDSPPYLPPV